MHEAQFAVAAGAVSCVAFHAVARAYGQHLIGFRGYLGFGAETYLCQDAQRASCFPFFAFPLFFFYIFILLFCFVVFRFLLDAFHFGHFPLAALVVLCFATICSLLFYLAILKIYNKGEHLKMNYLVVFLSPSASSPAPSCVFRRLLFFFLWLQLLEANITTMKPIPTAHMAAAGPLTYIYI